MKSKIITFLSNMVAPLRKVTHIPSSWEKMQLGRLNRDSVHCKWDKNKDYFVYEYNRETKSRKLHKVKILGRYQYLDVDGAVSNTLAQKESGEVIGIQQSSVFIRKPHEWVSSLSERHMFEYSNNQVWSTDEQLAEQFFNNLDVSTKRDIQLEKIISKL